MSERCRRCWTSGCRCPDCHRRLIEGARLRRAVAAVRAGRQPELRVAAGPSRRRLAALRGDGLSLRAISVMTSIPVGTLQHVVRADRARVALTTAQRLQAAAR